MRRARWRWLVVLVVVAAVGAIALFVSRDDDPGATTTTTTLSGRLQEAVLRADITVPGIGDEAVSGLIEDLCDTRDGADLGVQVVALGVTDADQVLAVVEGVGRGVASLCPQVPADEPQLLNEAYNAAIAQLDG